MEYGQGAVSRTRFDFDAMAAIIANQRRKERRKLRRLRKVKRALHFFGFLCYWAIVAGIGSTLITAAMVLFVFLS